MEEILFRHVARRTRFFRKADLDVLEAEDQRLSSSVLATMAFSKVPCPGVGPTQQAMFGWD
jgi:hypothetical protein